MSEEVLASGIALGMVTPRKAMPEFGCEEVVGVPVQQSKAVVTSCPTRGYGVSEPVPFQHGLAASALCHDLEKGSNATQALRPSSRQSTNGVSPLATAMRDGHTVHWVQLLAYGVWFALLVYQYVLVRLWCESRIINDCKPRQDIANNMQDFQLLLFMGFALAAVTGVNLQERFFYIFSLSRKRPRGLAFLVIYSLSGLIWGALGLLPSLKHFTLTSNVMSSNVVPLIALVVGGCCLIFWHLWYAFWHNSRRGFLAYAVSRIAIWAFYGGYLALASGDSSVTLHLHHYVLGFCVATLAEFNHPVSMILLAFGSGVFVQGIAAYGADPIIRETQAVIDVMTVAGNLSQSPPMSRDAADWVIAALKAKH